MIKRIFCFALTVCMCLCFFVACTPREKMGYTNDNVKVLFLNVDRADCAIVSADGKNYMIDTGEKQNAYRLIAALNYMGIGKLDGLILTHTHDDHIGGAKTLLEYVEIDRIYSAAISENKKNGENKIDNIAKNAMVEQVKLNHGDRIAVKDDVGFDVLGPISYNNDDDNDNSLVLKLNVNGKKILFTGDMQFAEEITLINAGKNLKADVLKVANHGNKDATSVQFANAVSPKYAIIPTNTDVDADSANTRVLSALSMADEIMITGEYFIGVLMTVSTDGNISFENPTAEEQGKLKITDAQSSVQAVKIYNDSDRDMDIGGFMLYSENGDELFVFPKESKIQKGQYVTVACEGYSGDFIWHGEDKAWNKKKGDIAILYDSLGNELSRMIVPISE